MRDRFPSDATAFAAAGNLGTGQSRLCTLTLVSQIANNSHVHDGGVGLDAENAVGKFDIADLFAGHIYNIYIRH